MESPSVEMVMKEDILNHMKKVLEKQDERLLKPIIEKEEYKSMIANDLYEDLTKIIVDHIEGKVQEAKLFRRQLEFYENILCELAKMCLSSTAGLMLTLIEYGQENSNDVFLVVLKPLEILVVGGRSNHNLDNVVRWCCQLIQGRLSNLTLDNHRLEGEELTLLELDTNVEIVMEMYKESFKFYKAIVENLNNYIDDLKPILISSLITILGNPMTNADLETKENGQQSTLQRLVKDIVMLVGLLYKNPCKFYECARLQAELLPYCNNKYIDSSFRNVLHSLMFPVKEFPSSGLANYFYLVFSENMHIVPKVYSHVYLFVENLTLSSSLVTNFSYLCINKGLKLIDSSLGLIEEKSLTSDELFQIKNLLHLFDTLINLIIYNDMKGLRLLGLKVFTSLLVKVKTEVLFLVLIKIEPMLSQHSGLKSEVISNIVIKNLCHYKEEKMYDLIKIYCKLNNGIETDVVNNKETIIASLNLIKYVKLNKYFTDFNKKYFNIIETNILKVLEEALKISKEHYEAFLEEVRSGQSDRNLNMNVQLKNAQILPPIDPVRQEECLKESLCAIDLIQWNLSALL